MNKKSGTTENLQVIDVSGEIDYNSAGNLRSAIARQFEAGITEIRLKLDAVEFIDSTGLSVLLDAVKQARTVQGSVTLIHPSRQLVRLLSVSGFAPFFNIYYADPAQEGETEAEVADDSLLTATFEAEAKVQNVAGMRKSVGNFVKALPFTKQDIDDIKLAVGEACTNALRYGCMDEDDTVRVTCTKQGNRVSVEINDPGSGFNPESIPAVSEGNLSEGGRGIFFMRCLMDEVNFNFTNGTTVELVKYLPGLEQ